MIRTGCFSVVVDQVGENKFHYSVLEAIDLPCELRLFRPLKTGKATYPEAHNAWFAGIDAVSKLVRKLDSKSGDSL